MSRFLIINCLLAACLSIISQAQGINGTASRCVTTVRSTYTVVPIAVTEYLPAPPSTTCNTLKVTCPACENEEIDVEGGNAYTVHCDAALSSNASLVQPAYITPNQCLLVCDSTLDCVGTTLSNGTCVLTTGPDYRLGTTTGQIAFVQGPYRVSNTSGTVNSSYSNAPTSKFFSSATIPVVYPTSYLDTTNTPVLHSPKPYYTNFTLPNATYPANASFPTGTAYPTGTSYLTGAAFPTGSPLPINNTCSLSNPTCPACDGKAQVDRHSVAYTVLCGYSLDATLNYALAEPLPAAYCMSRCDERNSTCLGASWSTEECVLALGPYVRVRDPDHMAFIRAAPVANPLTPSHYPILLTGASSLRPSMSTGPSYLNMSRYDGGSGMVTPKIIATNPAAQATVTITQATITVTQYPPTQTRSSAKLSSSTRSTSSVKATVTVTQPPATRPASSSSSTKASTLTIARPSSSTKSSSSGAKSSSPTKASITTSTKTSSCTEPSTPTAVSPPPSLPNGGRPPAHEGGPPPSFNGGPPGRPGHDNDPLSPPYGGPPHEDDNDGPEHYKAGRPPWSYWGWGRGGAASGEE
jgi:hypothetical protein